MDIACGAILRLEQACLERPMIDHAIDGHVEDLSLRVKNECARAEKKGDEQPMRATQAAFYNKIHLTC